MRFFLLFLATAVSLAAQAEPPLRVLFLGNSYTYYNNLPEMLMGVANTDGVRRIEAAMVTRGGFNLMSLWTRTNALATLREGKWDYVVLQEFSTLGSSYVDTHWGVNDPAAFFQWAGYWDDEIRRAGARTVFYMTWGRRAQPEFQTGLTWAYATAARERHALLAPAGLAWQRIRAEHPEIELFDPDGTHPSPAGTYLNACVFLEVLTGRTCAESPRQVTGHPTGRGGVPDPARTAFLADLPPADQAALAAAAHAAFEAGRAELLAELPRPDYGHLRPLPAPTAASPAEWSGTWTGPARLYREEGRVELRLTVEGETCHGRWSYQGARDGGGYSLPLTRCTVQAGELQFDTVDPRFVTEHFRAVLAGGVLTGESSLVSLNPYERLHGTWELRKP